MIALAVANDGQGSHIADAMEDKYAVIFGSTASLIILTFSMLTIACCCPKRKSSSNESIDQNGDGTERVDDSAMEEGVLPRIILDGKNSRVSVGERVNEIQKEEKDKKQPVQQSKPLKKIPENKAFQDFENAGIIIGMGKAPNGKTKTSTEEQNGHTKEEFEIPIQILQDKKSDELSDTKEIPVETMDSQTSYNNTSMPRPDVVHSTSLEEDEFSAIERNSDLLSSFKKPPPPCRSSKKGKRPMRKVSSGSLNQSATNSSLNEWSSVLDSFSFGPPLASGTSVTSYKKVTRQVRPDGSVVETMETSGGPMGSRASQGKLTETPTIIEVEEPTEVHDDILCETLRRTRRKASVGQNFSYDDSDMGTLKKKKQGEILVKHFPVVSRLEMPETRNQLFKSLNRNVSRRTDQTRGTLILDQYGNLVINKQGIKGS